MNQFLPLLKKFLYGYFSPDLKLAYLYLLTLAVILNFIRGLNSAIYFSLGGLLGIKILDLGKLFLESKNCGCAFAQGPFFISLMLLLTFYSLTSSGSSFANGLTLLATLGVWQKAEIAENQKRIFGGLFLFVSLLLFR